MEYALVGAREIKNIHMYICICMYTYIYIYIQVGFAQTAAASKQTYIYLFAIMQLYILFFCACIRCVARSHRQVIFSFKLISRIL